MNRTLGVLNMHFRDKFSWLWLPWIICLLSFGVNWLIAALTGIDNMFSGGVSSIYVYMLVMGIVIVSQTFSFSLGLGVRRIDYFLGTLLAALIVNVSIAVLLLLLSVAENSWLTSWGVGLHFFHLPFVHEGSLWLQFITHLILLLFFFTLGFAIGSFYRKIGRTGLILFFTLLFLLLFVSSVLISNYGSWVQIWRWIVANIQTLNDFTPWLVLGNAILALVSFGLLRKATPA